MTTRRFFTLVAVFTLVALSTWALAVAVIHAAQLPVWNNPPTQVIPGVEHKSFHSNSMNTAVGYNLLLPSGYDSAERRYPVLYWLHGLGGNENSDVSAVARRVMAAIKMGIVPPMIVVFVNGADFTFYADSPDKTIAAETAFISELVPHVDSTYRTIPGRRSRAIEGMSMGGFGALAHAMKHPDLFGSVVAYAPALLEVQKMANGTLTLGRIGGTHAGAPQPPPVLLAKQAYVFERMFGGSGDIFAKHSPWAILQNKAPQLRTELAVRVVIGTAARSG